MIRLCGGLRRVCDASFLGLTILLTSLGGYNVMNLDGGGSSTVYYNGTVINYPHCEDIPGVWCQRPITVISCIK